MREQEQTDKIIIMEVWAQDRDDLIASFRWTSARGGSTAITFAKEDFAAPLQKFIDQGLGEWVVVDGEQQPRVTLQSDAFFLPYLAAYIKQQNGMRVQLSWNGRAEQ